MAKKKLKNYVAVVLDSSGSMACLKPDVIRCYNGIVETVREQARKKGQETSVSLVTFSNHPRTVFFNAGAETFRPLTTGDYRCDGMTALFDAVGQTVRMLQGVPDVNEKHVSFLVIVITDGFENNSAQYRSDTLVALMRETQNTDRWSYAFNVPKGNKSGIIHLGIPNDNIREWDQTVQGVVETQVSNQVGVAGFYSARAMGQTQVKSFYTDLSGVTPKTVSKKLDDLSDKFRLFDVPKEASIKEFVEAKTKKPYVIGSAYYLLTKPEKVQANKSVLIMEKGKKAVWGGDEARSLVGIPVGETVKVTPGNHANYDIFCGSSSTNRKLVRGSKVLIDTQKQTHSQPTWENLTLVNS